MGYLDTKLGAVFIGNVVAACLYGVACIQAYNYFVTRSNDSTRFRLLLCALWLSDTIQLALVTHALYYYMVANFSNPLALVSLNWSILSEVFCTCISGIIVRGIFTMRVWLITRGNKILVTIIALASLSSFVFGFAFAIMAFHVVTFFNLQHISYLLYTAFASGTAADILIAASLCSSLSKCRTGFKRTDSLINVLILYAINSSLLTCLCSIGSLVTFAIWPTDFIFIAVFFSQSKMYTITLFASLNGRERLKAMASSDIPLSLPGRSWKSTTCRESLRDPLQTNQSVIVTVERKIEIDGDESS